jgi:hypothetical protein
VPSLSADEARIIYKGTLVSAPIDPPNFTDRGRFFVPDRLLVSGPQHPLSSVSLIIFSPSMLGRKTEDGRQPIVHHGHLREREVMTGISPVVVPSCVCMIAMLPLVIPAVFVSHLRFFSADVECDRGQRKGCHASNGEAGEPFSPQCLVTRQQEPAAQSRRSSASGLRHSRRRSSRRCFLRAPRRAN